MKKLYFLLTFVCMAFVAKAQTQLTTAELNSIYTTSNGKWVSVHDPSVVYRDGSYTIWGSHLGIATSSDLISFTSSSAGSRTFYRLSTQGASTGTACDYTTAFNTQQVTKVKNYLGQEVDFPNFDAEAYCARYADDPETWIDGVMWAPDIIWNESMQKWCLYMSLNGDNWSSIIILLTSSTSPTSGFTYQGPVVMGGFNGQTYSGIHAPTFDETDLNIAIGGTSIPSRYNQSSNGSYWPNCIDPCVFYDEDGELWMTYGSWSGGIFMLKLDKETGLRDYTYTYESDYDSRDARGTTDPYFGLKIAGGFYVSGEGSYIQHIGDYYYLFISYGGFAPDGGYEMRTFRSESPDGPYVDASGNVATYTNYYMNYGPTAADSRGMLLMEAYNDWGCFQNLGERAQGHNSACQDDKGRSFVVYHTKFNDGTDGHQVRTHQLFVNEKGWLVASPFVYQGETTTDESIASSQPWTVDELTGDYEMLLLPYKMDHANYEEMIPSTVTLNADGTVTGEMTGTWSITEGTGYIQFTINKVNYYGVICDQSLNGAVEGQSITESTLKAIAFTTTADSGTPLWAYKMQPQSAIAWNYKNNSSRLSVSNTVSNNQNIMFDTDNNTELTWISSEPDIISTTGKYAPVDTDTAVTMTAYLTSGDYYWSQTFNVTARAASAGTHSGDYLTGMVAYYDFDESPTINQYNVDDDISYGRWNSGTKPALVDDWDRIGQVAHFYYGASKNNSYGRMTNPLYGATDLEGFTISAWIKRTDNNATDAIWGFTSASSYTSSSTTSARFWLTGNSYISYTDGKDTWFKINDPDQVTSSNIPVGEWALVTIAVGPDNGIRLYVSNSQKTINSSNISASNGATRASALPIDELLESITNAKYLYLGNGSDGGSADFLIDDLIIYDRELSSSDARTLYTMETRVSDFTIGEGGTAVEEIAASPESGNVGGKYANGIYDLTGRRISKPTKSGIYIENGKKVLK